MRDEQLNIKISQDEKNLLRQAAKNLKAETGRRESISAAVRHSISKYAETDFTKPEMFLCNREAIREIEQNIEFCRAALQKFMEIFYKVTKRFISLSEMTIVFETLGRFHSTNTIRSAIESQVRKSLYAGLCENHPDMAISFDNVPDKDLTELFEAADQVNEAPEVRRRSVIFWQCYTIENNKLLVIEPEVEKLKSGFRFYAETPVEFEKLAKVKELCESLNTILKDPEVLPGAIFSLVYFDPESRRFAPSGSYIKFNVIPRAGI